MKRTKHIRLVLTGTMVAGVLAGCGEDPASSSLERPATISSSNFYTNNHYVGGMGYYHAAYHGFFPYPYNMHRPGLGYYHGGNLTPTPDSSPVAASRPSAETVSKAQAMRSTTPRGGFGSSGRSFSA